MANPSIKISASAICTVISVNVEQKTARVSFAGRLWDIKILENTSTGSSTSLAIDEQVALQAAQCFAHMQSEIKFHHQKLELQGTKGNDEIKFTELHTFERATTSPSITKIEATAQSTLAPTSLALYAALKESKNVEEGKQSKPTAPTKSTAPITLADIEKLSKEKKCALIKNISQSNKDLPITFYKKDDTPLTDFMGNFYEGTPISYEDRKYKCAEGAFHASKIDYIDDCRLDLVKKFLADDNAKISQEEFQKAGYTPDDNFNINGSETKKYTAIAAKLKDLKDSKGSKITSTTINDEIKNAMKDALANASGEDALVLKDGIKTKGNQQQTTGFDLYLLMGDNNKKFDQAKDSIMYDILQAKFANGRDEHDLLEATGDALLLEHKYDENARDIYWSDGWGKKRKKAPNQSYALNVNGNNLGKILMMIRHAGSSESYEEAQKNEKFTESWEKYDAFAKEFNKTAATNTNTSFEDKDCYCTQKLLLNKAVLEACGSNTSSPAVETIKGLTPAEGVFGSLTPNTQAATLQDLTLDKKKIEDLADTIYPKRWYHSIPFTKVNIDGIKDEQLTAINKHCILLWSEGQAKQATLHQLFPQQADIYNPKNKERLLQFYSDYLKKLTTGSPLSLEFLKVLKAFNLSKNYVIVNNVTTGSWNIDTNIKDRKSIDVEQTNFFLREQNELKAYKLEDLKAKAKFNPTTAPSGQDTYIIDLAGHSYLPYFDKGGAGHCMNACLADQMNQADPNPSSKLTQDSVRTDLATRFDKLTNEHWYRQLSDVKKIEYAKKLREELIHERAANRLDSKNIAAIEQIDKDFFNKNSEITLTEDNVSTLLKVYADILDPAKNGNIVAWLSGLHLEQYALQVNKRIVVLKTETGSNALEVAGVFMPETAVSTSEPQNTLWLYFNGIDHYYSMDRNLETIQKYMPKNTNLEEKIGAVVRAQKKALD